MLVYRHISTLARDLNKDHSLIQQCHREHSNKYSLNKCCLSGFQPCHVTEEAESPFWVLSIWAVCVASFLQLLDLLYGDAYSITHKFAT